MSPMHRTGSVEERRVRAIPGRVSTGARVSALLAGVLGVLLMPPLVHPASAYPSILNPSKGAHFGAVVHVRGSESRRDAVERLEDKIGRRLGIDHQYYKWDSAFPTKQETWDKRRGRIPFLNWKAERTDGGVVGWSEIAGGSQDQWIRRRATALSDFRAPIYLTFHHEPENDLSRYGTPADYAAAFERIVTLFEEEGVSNVAFVWTMMSWTFDPDSGRDPMAYYPGDGYVDLIGVDGYNWYGVRPDEQWRSLAYIVEPARSFAASREKPWIVVEYGVAEDPEQPGRKAKWFLRAGRAAERWPDLAGLVYFDSDHWVSDSSRSSIRAFRRVSNRNYFTP